MVVDSSSATTEYSHGKVATEGPWVAFLQRSSGDPGVGREMGDERGLMSKSAPRILSSLDNARAYSLQKKRRSKGSQRAQAGRRRAAQGPVPSQRRLPSLGMEGWTDLGLESFARGETPLWTEVAVPRPKTFNRDGRLHTPDWHRASFTVAGDLPSTAGDRAMLMTPYSASLHAQFIAVESPAVQADLKRRSEDVSQLAGSRRRHTASGESLLGRPGEGAEGSKVRSELEVDLAPLDRAVAGAPNIPSLMQQQGTYVANFIRQPTNAPTFLASEMQAAKGSNANGRKSRSRGQSYRLLAGTLLQASFQDQVSVLDREIQKQNYIRHIPRSLEPQLHHAALVIQCGWRGYLARQYMKLLNQSAARVQALWRGHQQRKRLRIMQSAATRIQACFRGRVARQRFVTARAAVITIQCGWRCFYARRRAADKRATRDGVALLLYEVVHEAAAVSERNAAKRRALRLARELAVREAKSKKKIAVKSLLVASEFGPVSCVIAVREEWDGVNGNPIRLELQVSDAAPTLKYSEKVRQVFDTMDVDGNGTLDRGEISELGEAIMGESMTEEQLDAAMAVMDGDGGGEVDFDEFLTWWMETVKRDEELPSTAQNLSLEPDQTSSGWESSVFGKFFGGRRSGANKARPPPVKPPPMQHSDDVVRRLFDKMDADGSGGLDRNEVANLAKTLGAEVESEADLDAAMALMDADGNGCVDYEEFKAWYQQFVSEQADAASQADAMQSGMRKFINTLSPKKRREKQEMAVDADRSVARTIFDSIDADNSGVCLLAAIPGKT
eukprot:COSAG02_NODE_5683_length_4131_cov_2.397817_2_plen_785_part_00